MKKICVSEEVYDVYHQMRRQERTLAEKDSRNFVLKYEDFADGEIAGEEQIYDFLQPSVEELALTNIIYHKLHRAIEMLPQTEREIITAIYFQGYSVHQLAKESGTPYMTISCRKERILCKLKKILES